MAQNAFQKEDGNAAFFSYRENAWHRSGIVIDEKLPAVDAYRRMMGDTVVDYREYPLVPMIYGFTTNPDDAWHMLPEYTAAATMEIMDTGKKAVYQYDKNGNPVGLVAVVSNKWRLIRPGEACEIWDRAFAELKKKGYGDAHIETMGFLSGRNKTADRFWIATKESELSIRGDQIRLYVTLYISMNDDSTLLIVLTPVRTVCENTWLAGQAQLVKKIQVAHTQKAPDQLQKAIQSAYLGLPDGILGLQEWLETLASAPMNDDQAKAFFEEVYELPSAPKANYHGYMDADQKKTIWEQKIESVKKERELALAGFSGGSFDYADTPQALHGTAYYAFQIVTQRATYNSGYNPLRAILEPTGTSRLEVARAERWLGDFVKVAVK